MNAGKPKIDGNTLFCSFCGKSQHDVKKLIAGPAVFICDECVVLCTGIIAAEAAGGHDGTGSPPKIEWPEDRPTESVLALLKAQNKTHEEVAGRLQRSIDILRKREVSWQQIGDALGISRQAAWERFS